jgi:hypothetical protein
MFVEIIITSINSLVKLIPIHFDFIGHILYELIFFFVHHVRPQPLIIHPLHRIAMHSLATVGHQTSTHVVWHLVYHILIKAEVSTYVCVDNIPLSLSMPNICRHGILKHRLSFLFFYIIEVAHASIHTIFIHTHSLLQNVQCSRDYVKLAYYFF